ncbi:F-box protein At1g10110 [Humulus lupulus]|uniref:F-box protein At1g10110 n=1 Tax=Humulus lupulus TaxID=3486 RepID=UPI002B412E6E|nr:F-box protein At1g10110 [Humulus lupulus]
MCSNKISRTKPSWSDTYTLPWQQIFSKLAVHDLVGCKGVCSSWNSCIKSLKISPHLMIPKLQHDDDDSTCRRFFTLAYENGTEGFFIDHAMGIESENLYLGSSQGWLVILNNRAKDSFILNPFNCLVLQLPSIETLPTWRNRDNLLTNNRFVSKAILIPNTKKRNKKWAVIIYGYASQNIAYGETGGKLWIRLACREYFAYCDILGLNGCLYALTSSNTVQVWNFQSSSGSSNLGAFPTKVMTFVPSSPVCLGLDDKKYINDSCFCQKYLVESKGEILLVTRILGNFVHDDDDNGAVADDVGNAAAAADDDTDLLILPYATMEFCAHKMELRKSKWKKVENLGGQALFVGGSESTSICSTTFSGYEANSIYFTDDNWGEMDNNDSLFGGHDNGVYNIETKEFKPCFDIDVGDKVYPPPFWILPSL